MAALTKTLSGTWKATIRRVGWPTVAKTFRTKRDAEDWARRTEDEMVRGVFIQRAAIVQCDQFTCKSGVTGMGNNLAKGAGQVAKDKAASMVDSAKERVGQTTGGRVASAIRGGWISEAQPVWILRALRVTVSAPAVVAAGRTR